VTTDRGEAPVTEKTPFVGAAGIGVSDLQKSADFYIRVLGMTEQFRLRLPDMDEIILGFAGSKGASVVLMSHTDGVKRTYRDLPVKIVLRVNDPVAVADAIRAEGLEVTREPEPVAALGNAVVGLAKDPDGYIIELLQR
jgi:lactoylglutathione lyase